MFVGPFSYWIMRGMLVVAGLFGIVAMITCHLLMPELCYDEWPGPPPLSERMPEIVVSLFVLSLFLVPHRLTLRGWLFWTRLALASLVAAYFVAVGVSGIAEGVRGGKAPVILPLSVMFILVGISVPGCLWWRRRMTFGRIRAKPAAEMDWDED